LYRLDRGSTSEIAISRQQPHFSRRSLDLLDVNFLPVVAVIGVARHKLLKNGFSKLFFLQLP
jgi:hypothetical protein